MSDLLARVLVNWVRLDRVETFFRSNPIIFNTNIYIYIYIYINNEFNLI